MCFVVGIEDILFDSVLQNPFVLLKLLSRLNLPNESRAFAVSVNAQLSSIQYHDESPTDPNRPGSLRKTTRRSGA